MFSVVSAKRDGKELHVAVQAGKTKLLYLRQNKKPATVEITAYPSSFIEALRLAAEKRVSAEFNFDPMSEHGGIVYPDGKYVDSDGRNADFVRIEIPDLVDKDGKRVYEAYFRCRSREATKFRNCLVGLWSDTFVDPCGDTLLSRMDESWRNISVKIENLSTPIYAVPQAGDEVELTFSFAMGGVDGEELAEKLVRVLDVDSAKLDGESIVTRLKLDDKPLHMRIDNVCRSIAHYTQRLGMSWHSSF